MSVLSKRATDIIGRHCDCSALYHPNHENCLTAQLLETPRTLRNCAVFFFIMHVAQNFQKRKDIKKEDLPSIFLNYLRTVLITVCAVNFYFWCFCILHNLKGRTSYSTLVYLTPLISGLPIFFDTATRKLLTTMTYSSFALETLMRRIYFFNTINRNTLLETMAFMILNALAMNFSSRSPGNKFDFYWFYKPKKIQNEIYKESLKYFAYGGLFSAFKVTFSRPMLLIRPGYFLREILKWKNLRLAFFNFIYVYLYNVSSYRQCPALSGFIAGVSYWVNPNLSVLSTLTAYVLQQSLARMKHQFPPFPYNDIIFLICNAVVVSTNITAPSACPGAYLAFTKAFVGPRVQLLDNLHRLSDCYGQKS